MDSKSTQEKKQKKILTGFFVFLFFMWLCTLISRSVYTGKLTQVTTKHPEKKSIEHVVETDGIIQQGSDIAIHTLQGLMVEKIYVRAGDVIKDEMVLFQLNMQDLEEVIEKKKLEIAKLEYRIADIKNNEMLEEQKRQLEAKRAGEDYAEADSKTGVLLDRAGANLSQAENKLQTHLENGVSITSHEDRQKAYAEYETWVGEGNRLQEELAKKKEESDISAQVIAEIQARVQASEQRLAEAEKKVTEIVDEAELAAAKAEVEAARNEWTAVSQELAAAVEQQKSTEEQLAGIRMQWESYVQNPRQQPDFSGEDSAGQSWESEKQALEESLKNAQYGQQDAQMAREEELIAAERKTEDTAQPELADSTAKMNQMELNLLKKDLEKYRKIYKDGGKVKSGLTGTVVQINLITGERTPDGSAVICADLSVPLLMEVMLTKEEKRYVNIGDEVTIKIAGGREQDLKINYMEESKNNPGEYRAIIYLSENNGNEEMGTLLGMGGSFRKSELSQSYECCIPTDALHSNAAGTGYIVYAMEEREGILGTELYAQEYSVKVLDKNDRYAALESGVITEESRIIVSADREFKPDDVVRLKE